MVESSQPEEKQYLRETHSDSLRGDPLITEDVSLLLKGKTFFYVFATRMKGYWHICSEEKIAGFSSYVEHTRATTQLLHEARINHKDFTMVWLDLANAYGFIPHQLIQVALHKYYTPDHTSNLIMNYFNKNHLRCCHSTGSLLTTWHSPQ